jgi:hypothetical protein
MNVVSSMTLMGAMRSDLDLVRARGWMIDDPDAEEK